MRQRRTLLSDGIWIAGMQGTAALGHLVGVRILTEMLPPATFGEFSLWLGVVALVASGLANPTMQALLRYYPEYAVEGNGALVRVAVRGQLVKLILWVLPMFAVAAITTVLLGLGDSVLLGLLVIMVAIEVTRMQNTALLNAVRAQRAYGVWAALDAWGRPLIAWLMIAHMGASTAHVLVGYAFASLLTWVVMKRYVPHDEYVQGGVGHEMLVDRIWKYTLPLLPLGILGWISGMADRYMIGALMSPADVGLYVAIYGLASRPMLMFGGIVETTIRPAYQSALVEGNHQRAHSYLRKWTLFIVFGCAMAIAVAWAGHPWIARILLGEPYRSASFLIPWIVGGYALLILSHVANRVCYANEATRSILLVEFTGATLAVIFGFICIMWAGLKGAAVAISLYYGVQLIMSFRLARHWMPASRFKL